MGQYVHNVLHACMHYGTCMWFMSTAHVCVCACVCMCVYVCVCVCVCVHQMTSTMKKYGCELCTEHMHVNTFYVESKIDNINTVMQDLQYGLVSKLAMCTYIHVHV